MWALEHKETAARPDPGVYSDGDSEGWMLKSSELCLWPKQLLFKVHPQ